MHDKNGTPLAKGDKVTVEFIITATSATEDYCNIQLETVEPFWPDANRHFEAWFNSKQTVKVE